VEKATRHPRDAPVCRAGAELIVDDLIVTPRARLRTECPNRTLLACRTVSAERRGPGTSGSSGAERLSSFATVVSYDAHGTGLSDPASLVDLPTFEGWTDDLHAVVTAAGLEDAVLFAPGNLARRVLRQQSASPGLYESDSTRRGCSHSRCSLVWHASAVIIEAYRDGRAMRAVPASPKCPRSRLASVESRPPSRIRRRLVRRRAS
jgi:hypothetical protein